MTEKQEATITQNTRVTLGGLLVLIALFGGTMYQATNIRQEFTERVGRMEVILERVGEDIRGMRDTLADNRELIQGHIGDPDIHYAELNRLDVQIRALEKRIDILERTKKE